MMFLSPLTNLTNHIYILRERMHYINDFKIFEMVGSGWDPARCVFSCHSTGRMRISIPGKAWKSKVFATRYVFSWDIALPSSACLGESRSLLCVGFRSIYSLLGHQKPAWTARVGHGECVHMSKTPTSLCSCPLPIEFTGMPAGCSVWNRHVGAMHTEALRAFSGCAHSVAEEELASWQTT